VVTKDWKYIYWPYGGDGMKPTEEMYHLAEDRMELVNRAVKNQHPEVLKELRGEYDKAVRSWRNDAVDYNNYEPYGDYYDRTISWSKKSDRLPK
jgi:hypothetical protein